jgi:hypothetical protein
MKLIGFVDGSTPAPPQLIPASTSTDVVLIANPKYDRWYDQDQQVLSRLLSSMTEVVLGDVVAATSAKEVWDALQRQFASSTRARVIQVRVDLAATAKNDQSAAKYFSRIKTIAAELAAADAPLCDDEVIAYLLAGLGANYDPFVTSMTTKSEALTLDDVQAHLLVYEARQIRHHTVARLQVGASAHIAGHGGPFGRRGRGTGHGRGRGRGPPSSG